MAPAAVLLVIPIAIVAGYRRSTGAIMICGALAIIAFAAFWLVLGGINGLGSGTDPSFPIRIATLYGGVLITLAAWTLSINAAAQARRWVWVALLIVAGYLTLAAVYASFSLQTCFGPDFACPPPNPLAQALIFVGYLACPVAALVYGIRVLGQRVRTPPDGLVVSSLRAERTADVDDAGSSQQSVEAQ